MRDTEVTGIPSAVRSEALECVQLAAAFAYASLLALLPNATTSWRLVYSTGVPRMKGAWPGRPRHRPGASFRPRKRQQAARTPKLRRTDSASRPLALARPWPCASYARTGSRIQAKSQSQLLCRARRGRTVLAALLVGCYTGWVAANQNRDLGAYVPDVRAARSQGEVSEWLKEHAWKACSRAIVTWVRIPPSPPAFSFQ